jgi:glycosyltransferase involved in cell wall biosynthesis
MTVRVMLVAPYERPQLSGGQARAGRLLADGLAADARVDFHHVVVPHQAEAKSFSQALRFRLRFYGQFLAALVRQRPQVVHFFSPCSAAGFAEKTVLAVGAKMAGARIVINLRSDLRPLLAVCGRRRRRWWLWGLRRYDGAICQFRALRDFFVAEVGLRKDRVFVVPNAVAPRAFHLTEEVLAQRFHERRLIFLGSLQEVKGVDTLLAAAGLLRDRGWLREPIDIVGEAGSQDFLAALSALGERLALGAATVFHGPKYGPEKAVLLERAGALVSPSRREGFPNVVLEALQAGVPVVLSETGAAADIAAAFGDAVRLVPVDAPDAVAEAVVALFAEPDAYRQAARAAVRICADFLPDNIRELYYQAYAALSA